MGRVTLKSTRENARIQLILMESLQTFGWQGKWEIHDDSIHIESDIGVSLEEYIRDTLLDYADGLRLALCLGEQLAALADSQKHNGEKYGVLFFNMKDITVVNKEFYLITNLSKVLPITDENQLVLQQPIDFNGFLAPELVGANTLPLEVTPSCAYYSLALLCLKALELDFDDGMDRLNGSKFFYMLQRCLEKNPKNRIFIYI